MTHDISFKLFYGTNMTNFIRNNKYLLRKPSSYV